MRECTHIVQSGGTAVSRHQRISRLLQKCWRAARRYCSRELLPEILPYSGRIMRSLIMGLKKDAILRFIITRCMTNHIIIVICPCSRRGIPMTIFHRSFWRTKKMSDGMEGHCSRMALLIRRSSYIRRPWKKQRPRSFLRLRRTDCLWYL